MAYVLGTLRRLIGRTRSRDHATDPVTVRARLEFAKRANTDLATVNAELTRTYAELGGANTDLTRANAELTSANTELARDNDRLQRAHLELVRANSELSRSVEELTAFAGEISHDLKSPLATVAGYAQLLGQLDLGYLRPAEYDEFLAEISDAADRMRWLIDNVLAYATAPGVRLSLARVELGPLIDEVVAARIGLLRHQAGDGGAVPRITVAPMPAVRADAVLLRRVIDNLISNALKYVRPGEAAQVHIAAQPFDGDWVRVEVADRGIGIPDGQHEAVFDGLHRAHEDDGYPGTGLGLAICRRIIQRHGGSIGASSDPRGGTRVWLTLPAAEPATSGAAAPSGATNGAAPGAAGGATSGATSGAAGGAAASPSAAGGEGLTANRRTA